MNAIHHISLSVTDLGASADWYRTVFRLEEVMHERADGREALVFRFESSRLMLGLVRHGGNTGGTFTPVTTGLDHVAFAVDSREALAGWAEHLDELDVANSGVIELPIGGIVNFTDPDGIQLSIFWER